MAGLLASRDPFSVEITNLTKATYFTRLLVDGANGDIHQLGIEPDYLSTGRALTGCTGRLLG